MTNFIGRHWRGEYSLPISYWLVNVALTAALLGFINVFNVVQSSASWNPVRVLICFVLILGLLVAASVWQYVGLWRSSWRYIDEKPKTKFWGYLALLMMCLGIIQIGLALPRTYFPIIQEYGDVVLRGDKKIPDYQLTLENKGEEILIKGGIKYGLVKDLEEVLQTSPNVNTIQLESVGGRFGVAFDLYKLIRKNGLNTVVNEYCLSACTLAFAGGWNRWLAPYARIGFHSGKMPGLNQGAMDTYIDGLWRQVADEQSMRLWAVREHSAAPHEDMSYPSRSLLLADNFITSNTSGAQSSFDAYLSANEESVAEMRSVLPLKIDVNTTLIGIEIRDLTNFYTYLLSDDVSESYERNEGVYEAKAVMNSKICENQKLVENTTEGVRYIYTYLRENTRSKWLSFELTCV